MFTERRSLFSVSGCIALSAAIASVLQVGFALAQESPATSGLEEIIVTAQRKETSLQETPVSITVFSADALQERGITSLLEISSFTPNLQVGSRSGQAGTQGGYAIRGVGVNAGGSSPAVGIYIDDVYFPSGAGNLMSLFDVSRVEVLRGPQGTLFGRNTIGGAIQYITVRPNTDGFSGFVEGTGGDFGREDFSGALNAPLGDKAALRLTLASRERDGYVHDDLNNVDRGSDDTKMGRLQFRWTPTDKLSFDFKAESLDQKSNGRALTVIGIDPNSFLVGLATRGLGPFSETRPYDSSVLSTGKYQLPGFNQPDNFDFNYDALQGTIAYKLTDTLTLTSITASSDTKTKSAGDFDNTPLSIIATATGNARTKLLTEELRLTGSSDRFNWATGLYYYDEDRTVTDGVAFLGLLPAGPFGVDNNIASKAYAVYGQGTYDFTDRLFGTLGVRYSSEQIDAKALKPYVVQGPPIPGFDLQPSASDTYTDTSPYLGLNFQVDPDAMIYVKASKGFRAGGFQFANPPAGLVPFKQETAWTYEFGARMELANKRLRLNPTLFYTDWNDIQFNALAPGAVIITQNAGDATMKGGELEMQFAATDRWLLDASVSYLDGHYTSIDPSVAYITAYPNGSFNPPPFPGPTVQQVDLALDDDMQQSPKTKYTAGARYSRPFSSGSRIVANLNYAWVDTIRSAVTRSNTVQMPSYTLMNAQVQYVARDDRWSVALFGTNLTDEYYLIGGVNFGTLGPGSTEVDPARPREYGVTVRFNF
jgi:iron complex outermembrane receptor protein